MKKDPSELTLLETFKSMAELMKKAEAMASANNQVEENIPNVLKELSKLNEREFGSNDLADVSSNEKYAQLMEDLDNYLTELGFPYYFLTPLTDVMKAGNKYLIDSDKIGVKTNLDFYLNRIDDLLKTAGDPIQAIDNIVRYDIEESYRRDIFEKDNDGNETLKPINKWKRTTIGFYSNQQNPGTTLEHVVYFLLVTKDGEPKIANPENISTALYELSDGVAKSVLIFELKKRRKEIELQITTPTSASAAPRTNTVVKAKIDSISNHLTYFELNTTYENLKKFKSELEHSGYISKSLSLDEFRRVFLCNDEYLIDKIKKQPSKPIDWLVNKSHLGYLIKQLSKNNVITDKEYYKIAENCFLYKGRPIPNTVFHGMQLPAINAQKKIDRIALLLVEKKLK